jgi:hypothetical protein
MLNKWVGKLTDGKKPYPDLTVRESIPREEEGSNKDQLKAKLAHTKAKGKTNPEEEDARLDNAETRNGLRVTAGSSSLRTDDVRTTKSANTVAQDNAHHYVSSANASMTNLLRGGDKDNGKDTPEEQQQQQQIQESELADLLEESAEIALDRISRLTVSAKDRLSPIAKSGISQLNVFREEGNDLKKLLSAKEIIIYKTDAIAIMLRKYGGIIEFLDAYDKLIREGYVLDHSEAVESFFEIPINGIKTRLGKLYYFHHRKYTAITPPQDLPVMGSRNGPDEKYIAEVFLNRTKGVPSRGSQK